MKTTIDILATADIGKKELETLIREAVEADTKRKVSQVKFKIGTRYEGYGPSEHEVAYFDGVHITFAKGE
jgi:hypothetical protein